VRAHCGLFFLAAFGCGLALLLIAFYRNLLRSDAKVSQGIAANFNIKYMSYLNVMFIFIIFIFIVIIIFIIIVIIDVIIKFIVNITILVAILHEESDSLTFESRNLSLSWRSARTKALECFNWPEVAALSAKENGWETQRLLRDDPLGQLTGVTMQDASTRHRRTNKHCGKARNEPDMFFLMLSVL
jgi:hypothetical protein